MDSGQHLKVFFCYALCDPRKPGNYSYGKGCRFSYEPFYIGKGSNNRPRSHINAAKYSSDNTPKLAKIRKILSLGYEVIIVRSKNLVTEEEAFTAEADLIAKIGRYDLGRGPLLNLTDGGDGVRGFKLDRLTCLLIGAKSKATKMAFSAERKREYRQRQSDAWEQMDPDLYSLRCARISEALRNRTEEEKEEARLKTRATFEKEPDRVVKKVRNFLNTLESMPEDSWKDWRAKIENSRASHTKEQKKEIARKMLASRDARSEEEKLASIAKQRASRSFNAWVRQMVDPTWKRPKVNRSRFKQES